MSNKFSPSEFMRGRRPELFSDTEFKEEPIMTRAQFEFHLDTLTQRKEEIRFEHFCRRLAEKELCPNLLPQTGPTGGGDSKVDSETYPIAETIAERWYEGDPKRAGKERWALAFSAKKSWKPKFEDDVRKIAETKRGYSLIYFITNQAVPDRLRAASEDATRKKLGVDVRILDRSWIVEKVTQNNRWDVVFHTLDVDPPGVATKVIPGPIDAERLRDLEELDRLIKDTTRYQGAGYQLAEDCLQTALLARGLGRSRNELDGRFDQAERIARNNGNTRQQFRILYQRAWTANWWFDDFAELDRLYQIAEPLVLNSDVVWDLEKLVNLWQVGSTWRKAQPVLGDEERWALCTSRLRESFVRHASNSSRPTSALWARTELALMDLVGAAVNGSNLSSVFACLQDILRDAAGHLDYPVETLIRIIRAVGPQIGEDVIYDELIESVICFQSDRVSKAEQGRIRLERGFQKLEAGKTYEAINQFSKAQGLLVQEEHKGEFIRAMVGTALGYEMAGLLWAARANLVVSLERTLHEYVKGGQIPPQALPILRKLIWIEIQLGRVPCILSWLELLNYIRKTQNLDGAALKSLEDELQLMDAVIVILILRTRFADWTSLDKAPGLLDRFSLFLSRGAALFSLGHEDTLRSEYGDFESDLDRFFSKWLNQPAAADLPMEAEWHLDNTVMLGTVIMGCEIKLVSDNNVASILLGEAILAFLESFLSTAIKLEGHFSFRSQLLIEIIKSDNSETPIGLRVEEDECGETKIIISFLSMPPEKLAQDAEYQHFLFELLGNFIQELQIPFSSESLEELFAKDRAQDRAFWAAQSPLTTANIFGETIKYKFRDWIDESLGESIALLRTTAWETISESNIASSGNKIDSSAIFGQPLSIGLLDVDRLKHRDFKVMSPINLPLWDKAKWRGLGFGVFLDDSQMPDLFLLFDNPEAGLKIFRGWQKRIGAVDSENWIGITVITDIDRRNPAHYRVAISANNDIFRDGAAKTPLFTVARLQTMTPGASTNLENFMSSYKKWGRYRVAPGMFVPDQLRPLVAKNISIEKTNIRIIPAWKIGTTDPERAWITESGSPSSPKSEPNSRCKQELFHDT